MTRVKGVVVLLFWVAGIPFLHAAVGDGDMHWFWMVGMVVGGFAGLYMIVTGKSSPFPDDQ